MDGNRNRKRSGAGSLGLNRLLWAAMLLIGLFVLTLSMAISTAGIMPVRAFPPTSNLPTLGIPTLAVPTLGVSTRNVATLSVPTLAAQPTNAGPTATRERAALTLPPDDTSTNSTANQDSQDGQEVAEPLLTLTAFSSTVLNQPTPTDGPSSLVRDGKPHMVDFNAFWCSPCNQMRPAVAALKKKYEGKITIDDINTDNRASAKLARQYKVQFIPLMVLLDKDLKEVGRLEGYQSQAELDAALSALIAEK